MTDAIRELRTRAEILHKRIQRRESLALQRLRALPPFRRASDHQLFEAATGVRRRDCLTVIAAEIGFSSWPQAKNTLSGARDTGDFGDLLCPRRSGGHINRWYKGYDEAAEVRQSCQGYLLAYRRQYLVVDRYYIEDLGLDADDPDWRAIGFDWVRPSSVTARTRLYGKLIAHLPRGNSH